MTIREKTATHTIELFRNDFTAQMARNERLRGNGEQIRKYGSIWELRENVTFSTPKGDKSREVILRDSGVVIIPIDDDGKLILIKQYREPFENNFWELPGGGIGKDKATGQFETPDNAAKREFLAETGYKIESVEPQFFSRMAPYMMTGSHYFFSAKVSRIATRTEQDLDETEIIEKGVKRVSLQEAIGMIREGEITNAQTVQGIMWYASTRDLEENAKNAKR